MQYAQVLDNAEVVTPFAAKLSCTTGKKWRIVVMHMPCMVKNLSMKQEILSLNFTFVTEAQLTSTHKH